MSQIFILLFFYFLVLYSILGYGRIFTLINPNYQASSFDGLLGLVILILISYSSNFFFPHNYTHNSLIIIFGILIFLYDFKVHFKKRVLEFKILTLIFFIIFIGLLIYKNHDDFYYYHFPYTLILTNFEKVFGMGNLNHGFKTPSSIFYLNSLFYLPGVKYFLMNAGAAYILGFSNYILFKNIRSLISEKKLNHILFLSLLSLIYINSSFARIAEHGTDRSALILIFLMSIFYLKSLDFPQKKYMSIHISNYYSKLAIIFTLIVTLKVFYLIYSLVFILWFFQIRKYLSFKKISFLIFKNYYSYLFLISFVFCIFTILSNTGCLIYPASFTCFENLSWSIPLAQVDQMHLWYEQWSKGGAGPNFRVENPELYVEQFNWVKNWLNVYFFNKVSDNILLIIFISFFIYLFFSHKTIKKNHYKNDKNYKFFYVLILILFMEWFYNHPSLRYGGYTLLALLFFIPVSIYLDKFNYNFKSFNKKIYLTFFLIILVFVSRNISRINKEFNQYSYNPLTKAFFYLNKDGFIINDKVKEKYRSWKKKNKSYLIIKK